MLSIAKDYSKFTFSPKAVFSQLRQFLILKPVLFSEITCSYFNTAFLFIILTVSNLIGYACARLLNYNFVWALTDLFWALLLKLPLSILLIFFSLLVSKGCSVGLSNGKLKFSYFCSSLLSSVHLPFSIFFCNLEKRKVHIILIVFIAAIQGLASHWLMYGSLDQSSISMKNIRFLIFSIVIHLAFYLLFVGLLYRG